MNKIQRLSIYTIILLFGFFALPNLYPDHPSITLSGQDSGHALGLEETHQQLSNLNIEPRSIQSSVEGLVIEFNNASDQSVAHQFFSVQPDTSAILAYQSTHPAWMQTLNINPMNLGLDLRGGVQLTLMVETAQSYQPYVDAMLSDLRIFNRSLPAEQRVPTSAISVTDNTISVAQNHSANVDYSLLLDGSDTWQLDATNNMVSFTLSSETVERLERQAIQQTLSVMRQRVESLGITEANIQQYGREFIRIELPGLQDPSAAKSLLGATTSIAFYEVMNDGQPGKNYRHSDGETIRLAHRAIVAGEDIVDASATMGEFGQPEVNIVLNNTGGNKMSAHSRNNIGAPMATLFSEYQSNTEGVLQQSHEVISVATIQSQFGSRFRVTGVGDFSEAQTLASVLRSGALSVPISIVDEQIIGPTLGEENVRNGFLAVALGLVITFISMLVLYGKFGAIACAALATNIIMILGFLSMVPGVALTLPGIAGLVLTMGMAVDCNVLVFERIKEIRRQGVALPLAIKRGYKESYSTIIDANLTSLITAIILFAIGYGAVKGFAVTLGIGIITSLFTGLMVSQMWMTVVNKRSK